MEIDILGVGVVPPQLADNASSAHGVGVVPPQQRASSASKLWQPWGWRGSALASSSGGVGVVLPQRAVNASSLYGELVVMSGRLGVGVVPPRRADSGAI
jgi:hypothetical protein